MYLNYYAAEVNEPDDNPPIGIQIFAFRYVLHMPDKEQLIAQVEDVLNKWHN